MAPIGRGSGEKSLEGGKRHHGFSLKAYFRRHERVEPGGRIISITEERLAKINRSSSRTNGPLLPCNAVRGYADCVERVVVDTSTTDSDGVDAADNASGETMKNNYDSADNESGDSTQLVSDSSGPSLMSKGKLVNRHQKGSLADIVTDTLFCKVMESALPKLKKLESRRRWKAMNGLKNGKRDSKPDKLMPKQNKGNRKSSKRFHNGGSKSNSVRKFKLAGGAQNIHALPVYGPPTCNDALIKEIATLVQTWRKEYPPDQASLARVSITVLFSSSHEGYDEFESDYS